MPADSKRRFVAVVLAVAVFIVGVPAIAALLFFPVMYLAGAHTGVLSGPLAGAVWAAGVAAAILVPAWLAVRTYRRILNPAAAAR
jgi:hypothetical protein